MASIWLLKSGHHCSHYDYRPSRTNMALLLVAYYCIVVAVVDAQKFIASGLNTNCAILTTNATKCWGLGGYNGDEDTADVGADSGTMGSNLAPNDWGTNLVAESVSVGGEDSLGASTTCAVVYNPTNSEATRQVRCFGNNAASQLGNGVNPVDDAQVIGDQSGEMGTQLVNVDFGSGWLPTAVSVGGVHVCALMHSSSVQGKVKCWGAGNHGQLGNGNFASTGSSASGLGDNLPFMDISIRVISISAGFRFTCVVASDTSLVHGDVYCTGAGDRGQIGQGSTSDIASPAKVNLGTGLTARKVVAGGTHACALIQQTNQIKCWGDGAFRANGLATGDTIGDGSGEMGNALIALDFGSGITVADVFAGPYHTCVLLSPSGALKCFGYGDRGQLGQGDVCNQPYSPVDDESCPVTTLANLSAIDLGGLSAVSVSLGAEHTCALTSNLAGSRIKCFGSGLNGQLGYEDRNDEGASPGTMGSNLAFVQLGEPSTAPTTSPTSSKPTQSPTTSSPTSSPSKSPTSPQPTSSPTTPKPTTAHPSASPTSSAPSHSPSKTPSKAPSTSTPTKSPSKTPSSAPVPRPSFTPTKSPTFVPTRSPSTPTNAPTISAGAATTTIVGIAVGSSVGALVLALGAFLVQRRVKSSKEMAALGKEDKPATFLPPAPMVPLSFGEQARTGSDNPKYAGPSKPLRKEEVVAKLQAFYGEVEPEKTAADIRDLADWVMANGEEALYAKLRGKYGADPNTKKPFGGDKV